MAVTAKAKSGDIPPARFALGIGAYFVWLVGGNIVLAALGISPRSWPYWVYFCSLVALSWAIYYVRLPHAGTRTV